MLWIDLLVSQNNIESCDHGRLMWHQTCTISLGKCFLSVNKISRQSHSRQKARTILPNGVEDFSLKALLRPGELIGYFNLIFRFKM